MAARDQVLALPELTANILLHVDQQTLLISAQRVCKAWRDLIHSVPSLTRHLFLDIRPASDGPYAKQPRRFNPLLMKAFPSFFKQIAHGEEPPKPHSKDIRHTFEDTGIFKARPQVQLTQRDPDRTIYSADEWKEAYDREVDIESQNPFLRHGASWLRMHVCDPPITQIGLHSTTISRGLNMLTYNDLEKDDGLRMDDLYRYLLLFAAHSPSPDFSVLWPRQEPHAFTVEVQEFDPDNSADSLRTFKRVHKVVEPPVLIQKSTFHSCMRRFDDRQFLYISVGYSFFGGKDRRMAEL
ncbi:hypothetical protein VHEMI08074 [[Torrubiella] hemipterigena]|uniref:F-box domain-containing protein n=1 Tax=[Torrubiella] hemipterigena TaxID=1531966 RepID=A0A0A1TMI8_9HYPO|nr:hypothetical protein VHEMI08074 [[Torrubiella] hemipterigena]